MGVVVDINGTSAMVTGGAPCIGAASVRQLAARGARVIVADHAGGAEVAEDVGGIFVSVDVTRSERASKSGHNPAKLSEHVLPRGPIRPVRIASTSPTGIRLCP